MTDQTDQDHRKQRISKRFIQDPLIPRFDPKAPESGQFEYPKRSADVSADVYKIKSGKKQKIRSDAKNGERFYEVSSGLKDAFKKSTETSSGFSLLKHLGREDEDQLTTGGDKSGYEVFESKTDDQMDDHKIRGTPSKHLFREKFFFDGPNDERMTRDQFFDEKTIGGLKAPDILIRMKKQMIESISKKKRFMKRQKEMEDRNDRYKHHKTTQ